MQAPKPLTKPTKQRKMLYNAPAHVRHRLLAAHLSRDLSASHEVKSLPVRSGDTVRVMRGDHRGVEGKVTRVDLAKYRVYLEGLTREKVDGTTVFLAVHPSKVMITRLNLDDKWRKNILETKKERRKKPEEVVEKPEEVVEKPVARPVEEPKEAFEVEKAVEEKPPRTKKAARKRIKRTAKKTHVKKVSEKSKPEARVTEKEEKPRPKRRVRRRSSKTVKKTEEEGQ